jgi:hypothetical protein
MFTKVFTLALAGFATLAVAAPTDGGSGGSTTASPQCCQHVDNSSHPWVSSLVKAVLGIDVSGLNVPIGTGCAPISVLGGVSCNQNPVTCGAVYQSKRTCCATVSRNADVELSLSHRHQLRSDHRQRLGTGCIRRGHAYKLYSSEVKFMTSLDE